MDEILLVINFCAIIMCMVAILFEVRNYKKSDEVRELHVTVAAVMALCGHYVRGMDFFLRKNGGDDHFEEDQPVKYVNHIDELKIWIEE